MSNTENDMTDNDQQPEQDNNPNPQAEAEGDQAAAAGAYQKQANEAADREATDGAAAAADSPDSHSPDEAAARIAALESELAAMKDKAMRALAEAENTRRRAEKAQSDTSKFAVTGFAKDMLEVSDNLRRALEAVPEEHRKDNEFMRTIYEGIEATERRLLQMFEKHGIAKLEQTEGRFDPNFHEVMFEGDVPGKQAGEIIQLLEAGYTIHGRLLRPARVGVAKGDPAAGPSSTDAQIDKEV